MFKKSILSRALAATFSVAVVGAGIPTNAYSQSNATGTIYGDVGAGDGYTVVIENIQQRQKRTVTPQADGRFQVTSLTPGSYNVRLLKGETVVSLTTVEVLIGQGVKAELAAQQLSTVNITGRRTSIDVSSSTSTSTLTSTQLSALPLQQNLNSIILLAPGTVAADPRYAGGASIGGGGASENSYYIDGFPVTNPLTQLGSIELPFAAIQQSQVQTGGFGADFGRSTGGVVNITTKSGGETWEGGGTISFEPNFLRSKQKNINYPNTGAAVNSATDGTNRIYQRDNNQSETQYTGFISGPLVKDKIYIFAAADETKGKRGYVAQAIDSSSTGLNGWTNETNTTDKWLVKLDWIINDDNKLSFLNFGDNYYTRDNNYSYDYTTHRRGSTAVYNGSFENDANITPQVGGQASMLSYRGTLTQDLTLTAVYGEIKAPHKENYNPSVTTAPGVSWTSTGRAPGINYVNLQPLVGQDISTSTAQDSTKSFRLDAEYKLGSHLVRVGIDKNELSSANAGQVEASGGTWGYRVTTNPTRPISAGPYTFTVAGNGALSDSGYYVRRHVFSDVTDARSDQSAQYIEDRWQALRTLLITAGLRNESFSAIQGDGQTWLKSNNFISPRLAAAWDVLGDSSLKLFGTAGRYSIQTPTHLSVRGASRSTLTYQYYAYTGVDPVTGAPTGLVPLTPAPYSPDGETGRPKDPNAIAATNVKPSYQDELRFGIEKAFSRNYSGGVTMTYRRLGATLDDWCDGGPIANYATAHNIDQSNYPNSAYDSSCLYINPGQANTLRVDYAGTGKGYTYVNLSAADIGLPKARRTYLAFDFFLEHAFADNWYGRATYTLSRSRGNTEGQTKSDIGQTDVSATETWDFPNLMEGSYGSLPNDRTHIIKAYGLYQATKSWGFGATTTAASGRPKNCFGNYGGTNGSGDYGSAYFYCSFDGGATSVPTPRGSQGRLPWDFSVDANVIYEPAYVKGLGLRVDIFNLFNRQSVQAISETHEVDYDPSTVLGTYGQVLRYSDPRAVRLTASYKF